MASEVPNFSSMHHLFNSVYQSLEDLYGQLRRKTVSVDKYLSSVEQVWKKCFHESPSTQLLKKHPGYKYVFDDADTAFKKFAAFSQLRGKTQSEIQNSEELCHMMEGIQKIKDALKSEIGESTPATPASAPAPAPAKVPAKVPAKTISFAAPTFSPSPAKTPASAPAAPPVVPAKAADVKASAKTDVPPVVSATIAPAGSESVQKAAADAIKEAHDELNRDEAFLRDSSNNFSDVVINIHAPAKAAVAAPAKTRTVSFAPATPPSALTSLPVITLPSELSPPSATPAESAKAPAKRRSRRRGANDLSASTVLGPRSRNIPGGPSVTAEDTFAVFHSNPPHALSQSVVLPPRPAAPGAAAPAPSKKLPLKGDSLLTGVRHYVDPRFDEACMKYFDLVSDMGNRLINAIAWKSYSCSLPWMSSGDKQKDKENMLISTLPGLSKDIEQVLKGETDYKNIRAVNRELIALKKLVDHSINLGPRLTSHPDFIARWDEFKKISSNVLTVTFPLYCAFDRYGYWKMIRELEIDIHYTIQKARDDHHHLSEIGNRLDQLEKEILKISSVMISRGMTPLTLNTYSWFPDWDKIKESMPVSEAPNGCQILDTILRNIQSDYNPEAMKDMIEPYIPGKLEFKKEIFEKMMGQIRAHQATIRGLMKDDVKAEPREVKGAPPLGH